MKMKHLRIPSFLLAAVLFLSVFFTLNAAGDRENGNTFVASALTYVGNCGENCKWTLNLKSGTLIIDGSGATDNYSECGECLWYKYRDSIKKVTVSGSIKSIGSYFFACLDRCEEITLSSSVSQLGDFAFYGCSRLREVKSPSSKLKKIGESAFAYCRKLKTVPAFSHLKEIGKNAFLYCYSLDGVALGYSVSAIGEGAFNCCESLKKLRIVNYDCDIFDSAETIYDTVCVESFKNSNAKKYADKYSRRFKLIKDINYLSDLNVKLEYRSTQYNKTRKTPAVKIKGLKEGRDFTVSYRDNKEPGAACACVNASGNTLGEKTVTFKIVPQRVKNIKLTARKTHSLSISWSKVHGADKYEVFMLSGNKWVKKATVKKTAYTARGLSGAGNYSFRVRAVTVDGKTKCTGKFSPAFTSYTKPEATEITKISLIRGGGKLRVSVKRVNGVDGYEILMSTKENGKYKKAGDIVNNKKLYTVIDNLNSSDTYYFKVRSYIKNGKAVVYSTVSSAVASGAL